MIIELKSKLKYQQEISIPGATVFYRKIKGATLRKIDYVGHKKIGTYL